jgi:hypothetical protein
MGWPVQEKIALLEEINHLKVELDKALKAVSHIRVLAVTA